MDAPRTSIRAALLALCAAAPLAAQDGRPVAIVHARVLTMTDAGVLEDATILIRDGRIEAVGVDVDVPVGARVVDAAGGTVMPGLVQAWSEAGVDDDTASPDDDSRRMRFRVRGRGGRSSGSKPQNNAAKKVAAGLYARQDVFGDLAEQGVTTLVVRPSNVGYAGLSARLDPSVRPTEEGLVVDDDTYLVIEPANDAKAKELIAEAFDKAKEVLEERKKPKPAPEAKPEEKPKAEEKPADAPAEKPAEEEKKDEPEEPEKEEGEDEPAKEEGEQQPRRGGRRPQGRREPKKDPNVEAIADALDGQRPVFVRINSATDVLHWLDGIGDRRFPKTVLVADRPNPSAGRLDQATEQLKELGAPILMTPHMPNLPFTREITNPARALHDAGIEVGFVLPEDDRALVALRFTLMELVRAGLPADVALRAATTVPAKALGLAEEIGSVADGRRADLLLFTGDPLDPTAELKTVYVEGRALEDEERATR